MPDPSQPTEILSNRYDLKVPSFPETEQCAR